MAQTEVRNLDLVFYATQNNVLFAPVKLQRITSFEVQRNKGLLQL